MLHSPPRRTWKGSEVGVSQQHLHGAVFLEELAPAFLSIFLLVTGSPQVDAGSRDDLLP